MIKLDIQGVLHPYAHMSAQDDFYQVETEVVIATMTQLFLKAGLK